MSGIIKAGSSAMNVAPIASFLALGPMPRDAAPAERTALDEASAEITRLRATIDDLRTEAERAQKAARHEGEEAGYKRATDQSDQRFALLAKAIDGAQAAWSKQLATLEDLAVMVARAAIARIVDEQDDLAGLVTRQISRRVAMLRDKTVTAIRVSTVDFSDEAALTALGRDAGTGMIELVADPALGPGDCRFDLELGHLDIGLAQWRELDAFLVRALDEVNAR